MHLATDKFVCAVDRLSRSGQHAFQRLAAHSFDLPALIFLGVRNPGEIQYRGHDVPDIGKGVNLLAAFDPRSCYKHGAADASFGDGHFEQVQWACAGGTPTYTIGIMGHGVSNVIDAVVELGVPLAATVARIVFAVPGIRAVIRQKNHDGVVVFTDILEKLHDPPEMVIHVVYHAGIDFHSS